MPNTLAACVATKIQITSPNFVTSFALQQKLLVIGNAKPLVVAEQGAQLTSALPVMTKTLTT